MEYSEKELKRIFKNVTIITDDGLKPLADEYKNFDLEARQFFLEMFETKENITKNN